MLEISSILNATRGVVHFAAAKTSSSCGFTPWRLLKLTSWHRERIACIVERGKTRSLPQTDKAVYLNGISKAMMEKVMVAKSQRRSEKP